MAANTYSSNYLKQFTTDVFKAMGSTDADAQQAADVLIAADLRGVDSHGVARLSGYVKLWQKGRLNGNPHPKIVHETPSTAVLDADLGAGLVTAPQAMKIAMEKARAVGTGWVAVKNSNHFGIAGYHAMMALEEDMIGWAFTNASPLVAPTHSKSRLLGTNPIAVAFPALNNPPIVIDMATTTVANGKLEVLQRKGLDTPDGWTQDKEGMPSNRSTILKEGGAMRPLGSNPDLGSHKGYCLASMVDILSGVLGGANYGPWVPPFVAFLDPRPDLVGEGIGHFVGAMRIDAFRPANEFKAHIDNWIDTFRKAENIYPNQKVLIPGDPERELTEHRLKNGIELLPPVVADLTALANELGLTFNTI